MNKREVEIRVLEDAIQTCHGTIANYERRLTALRHFNNLYDPTLPGMLEKVERVTDIRYRIKPFGFLEGLDIRLTDPIPNMDANNRHEFTFNFGALKFDIFARVRNIR